MNSEIHYSSEKKSSQEKGREYFLIQKKKRGEEMGNDNIKKPSLFVLSASFRWRLCIFEPYFI